MSVVITVAPTGPIATKADNPSLPTTPEGIAAAAEEAHRLGASVVHVHLRAEKLLQLPRPAEPGASP